MKLGNSNINKIYIGNNEIIKAYLGSSLVYDNSGGGAFDSDAQSFINAIGTLDSNQQNAINNLVLGFKASGSWSKYYAIYPFIGGTESSHKWNLKDARDLDEAYRITWNGSIVHNENGVQPDGSTGYGNPHIYPAITNLYNNSHLAFYSKTDGLSASEIASDDGATVGSLSMSIKNNDFFGYHRMYSVNGGGTNRTSMSGVNALGLWQSVRIGSNDFRVFRNGSQNRLETANVQGAIPLRTPFLWATHVSNGNASFKSNRLGCFIGIGEALTPSQVAQDYTTIQDYQTALGRAE